MRLLCPRPRRLPAPGPPSLYVSLAHGSPAHSACLAAYTVMTGTDAKTERSVCLKVTADYARHTAEANARRRLSPEYVVEFFDSLEDTLGNYTTVLGARHCTSPEKGSSLRISPHS